MRDCFICCADRETFVGQNVSEKKKSETFFVSRTQILCSQLMLRARANRETLVSATMCQQHCVSNVVYSFSTMKKRDLSCPFYS